MIPVAGEGSDWCPRAFRAVGPNNDKWPSTYTPMFSMKTVPQLSPADPPSMKLKCCFMGGSVWGRYYAIFLSLPHPLTP